MARSRSHYLARYGRIVFEPKGETVPDATKTDDATKTTKTDDDKSKSKDDDKSKQKAAGDDKSKLKDDDKSKDDKPVTFTRDGIVYVAQSEADRLANEARTTAAAATKKAIEDDAAKKKLEEAGDYKALWEAAEAEKVRLESELAVKSLDGARITLGAKYGLSATLSTRLIGATEAEIEADAKKIAKELGLDEKKPARKASSTEAGQGSRVRQRSSGTDATEEEDDDKAKKQAGRRYRFQKSDDVSWGQMT